MDLREYLFRKRKSLVEFSQEIKYERTYISSIIHGRNKPGRKFAEAVEVATGGEVTYSEMLNVYQERHM